MQRDSTEKLSPLTLFYHWTIGLLMIGAMCVGYYAAEIMEKTATNPSRHDLIYIHKNVGVFILLLAIGRIAWRYTNGFFQHAAPMKEWETMTAKVVHWILLIATAMMPLSGILMSLAFGCVYCVVPVFGLFEIGPFEKVEWAAAIGYVMHSYGSKVIMAIILFHAAAALKHHYWDKDGTLRRMLGQRI